MLMDSNLSAEHYLANSIKDNLLMDSNLCAEHYLADSIKDKINGQ
jgi:hypothetical protein